MKGAAFHEIIDVSQQKLATFWKPTTVTPSENPPLMIRQFHRTKKSILNSFILPLHESVLFEHDGYKYASVFSPAAKRKGSLSLGTRAAGTRSKSRGIIFAVAHDVRRVDSRPGRARGNLDAPKDICIRGLFLRHEGKWVDDETRYETAFHASVFRPISRGMGFVTRPPWKLRSRSCLLRA